jgi:hypothetical protein
VTAEFNLNLFPFYRIKGQELPQLPGLLAVTPPKHSARGRVDDHLLIYLTISGNTPISSTEYNQIMTQMTQRFYKTSGSLTSAVRASAESLNQFLLNRNLGTTGKGQYIVGRLILGVLRGAQFVFAQCGPTHVFHLTGGETRQIHDAQIAGHGLGIGQTTPLYFAQADLHPGDLLVLCPDLPAGWDNSLLNERNISPESLRRKLLGITGDDLNAVLMQTQAGNGSLNILPGAHSPAKKIVPSVPVADSNSSPTQVSSPADVLAQSTPSARPTSQVESERPASRFTRILSGVESVTSTSTPDSAVLQQNADASTGSTGQPVEKTTAQPAPRPASIPVIVDSHPTRRTSRFVSPHTTTDIPEIKRPPSRRRQNTFRGLAKIIQGVRGVTDKISERTRNFLPNLLPNLNGDSEVTSSSMALLAIIIPVIIVAIAGTIYVQYGRTTQFKQNYEMALAQAAQARGQTNATEVRRAWDSTLYYLDLAEKNQKTQDSLNLRQEAQTALDNLDGILRLNFRPAIVSALSRTVQISQMAGTDTDLYLLDASRGSIIRAFLTNQSYEVDSTFKCDPGTYGSTVVDTLVDLETLPMSNIYNARVMGMDAKGTLLYCGLADPVAVALVPPQLGWKKITAFSLDSDGKNLYVLDPASNAVWQYAGNFGQFSDLPIMFFGEQVPQNMNTAIALAANNADLYLLFQDGHITSCPLTRYDVVPMRCTDPATFIDARPERQPGPKINDAIFTQMTFASAPDPSLYMLEPLTRAIYRFSPRSDSMELRGQFRATMEQEQNNSLFDAPATALTISPNRYIFFSVGNQVFFATDVP